MTGPVARHRTAMSRSALSRPLATAVADELLTPSLTVFDYGCGRGDDLRHLATLGYTVNGWDPSHRPDTPRQPADVVNLGYVVNVIERADERAAALRSAWALTSKVLIVSARLTWDARDLVGRPMSDGLVTRTGTFQKFYQQSELAAWINQTLGVESLAAAPGIFYVFREPAIAQQYLSTRVHTYRPRVQVNPHATYEAHKEQLAPVFEFLTAHARPPRLNELPAEVRAAIESTFGSIGRAIQLIRRVTDEGYWEQVAKQRRSELLVYIALSRFGRRLKLRDLPPTLSRDIKTLFGSYESACVQADRLLFAAGNRAMILLNARTAPVGKQTPSALYIHRSALAELPPVLQVYEGCARVLSGNVAEANLIKLSVRSQQVSYLSYPQFQRNAHPTLATSVTVSLNKLSVDWRDYSSSSNPPLLHRKEEFLGAQDPRRKLYSRLTRAEVRAGLYERPELIGTLTGWRATLDNTGYLVRGHRLYRQNR